MEGLGRSADGRKQPTAEGRSPNQPQSDPVCRNRGTVVANGREVAAELPCSIAEFLTAQAFLPRSVVVEHNGEAVAPSEFAERLLRAGDRLEIVRIVAGG